MSKSGSSSNHTQSRVSPCHFVRPWSYDLNPSVETPPLTCLTVTPSSASGTPWRRAQSTRSSPGISPVPHWLSSLGGPTSTIPTLTFTPGVHVNYGETVLRMRDGLPKLKDFPAELGGSGEVLAE